MNANIANTKTADRKLALTEVPAFETAAPEAVPAPAAKKPSRAKVVLPALVAVAAAGAAVTFWLGHGTETTDDAQVEGHVATVAARVPGQVKRVLVKDNQEVKAGDVLVELDDRDLATRLAAARADQLAARAQVRAAETQLALTETTSRSNLTVARGGVTQAAALEGTTRAGIDQARADVASAEARASLAKTDLGRAQRLFDERAVAQAELDARQAAFDQADAALTQARARLTSAEANLGSSRGSIETARGHLVAAQSGPVQVQSAQAQLELAEARLAQTDAAVAQAELNLSYAKVRAETSGTVARRTVEPGQMVAPERPLLALVALDDTWVVANFKEDQLRAMRAGAKAEVEVDTYGGRKLAGHVESFAPGTGSRFSLLPPDNASGNFTKVVQRVPVLVRLDGAPGVVLRPGMSATVRVSVAD
ncbi:MAG TPA: HlyD family secretion protein [Polyangia bacterium]|nr:HlyD family secretion protein [Polyangia bacterium]